MVGVMSDSCGRRDQRIDELAAAFGRVTELLLGLLRHLLCLLHQIGESRVVSSHPQALTLVKNPRRVKALFEPGLWVHKLAIGGSSR